MKQELLIAFMLRHLNFLKGFPLDEILKRDPELHGELIAASMQVDKAYFRETPNELITAINECEKKYLEVWNKHLDDESKNKG